jgi:predicted AAA+ superfamily ATPase
MPVPGAMTSHENRNLWFDGYLHTYLERDIRDLARIQSLPDFDRLLRLVAARTGKILSYSDLARDAALSVSTARSYLNLATIAYFVRLLRPFHSNLGKRLVKAPKAMLLDSGLAAHFLGASVFADLERSNQVGAIVETWVHAQILALLGRRSKSECLYYWRTHAGAEVDFVIEHGERLLPIEVKWSTTVSPSDLRGLTSFLDDHAERAPFGLVLHRAASPMALGPRILSLPLTALFERAARR